jgi:hypothetical protein
MSLFCAGNLLQLESAQFFYSRCITPQITIANIGASRVDISRHFSTEF